jgi:hypothetical protein
MKEKTIRRKMKAAALVSCRGWRSTRARSLWIAMEASELEKLFIGVNTR